MKLLTPNSCGSEQHPSFRKHALTTTAAQSGREDGNHTTRTPASGQK